MHIELEKKGDICNLRQFQNWNQNRNKEMLERSKIILSAMDDYTVGCMLRWFWHSGVVDREWVMRQVYGVQWVPVRPSVRVPSVKYLLQCQRRVVEAYELEEGEIRADV